MNDDERAERPTNRFAFASFCSFCYDKLRAESKRRRDREKEREKKKERERETNREKEKGS